MLELLEWSSSVGYVAGLHCCWQRTDTLNCWSGAAVSAMWQGCTVAGNVQTLWTAGVEQQCRLCGRAALLLATYRHCVNLEGTSPSSWLSAVLDYF